MRWESSYNKGIRKLRSNDGVARLVIVFTVIAVVLALLIIIPIIRGAADNELAELDAQTESAAERSVSLEYVQSGETFTAIFDNENKQFVDVSEAKSVTPYGATEAHSGQVLMVTVDPAGEVSLVWVTP